MLLAIIWVIFQKRKLLSFSLSSMSGTGTGFALFQQKAQKAFRGEFSEVVCFKKHRS